MLLEKRNRLRRALTLCWLIAPQAWMGVIYWFSAQPKLPHAPDALMDLLLRKGAHMAEYAVLLLLWWRALSVLQRPRLAPRVATVIMAWTLTVLYAASDEYHQTFVPGRHGRLMDAAIDAAGASLAVLGLWLGARFQAWRSRLKL